MKAESRLYNTIIKILSQHKKWYDSISECMLSSSTTAPIYLLGGGLRPRPSSIFVTSSSQILNPISSRYICENMNKIHELDDMALNVANSLFIAAPHLKVLFHPGKQAFYPFALLDGKLLSEGNESV